MRKTQQPRSVFSRFVRAAEHFSSRPALEVGDQTISYERLLELVSNIARTIKECESASRPLGAILAYRSVSAFAGVLGVLGAGKGYVPLSPYFPQERTKRMLSLSSANVVVGGSECLHLLGEILGDVHEQMTIILPDISDSEYVPRALHSHNVITSDKLCSGIAIPEVPMVSQESLAYMLFTSGSTGEPKIVPVSQGNVASYVDNFCSICEVTENDRFSQNHDLTFDFSVHDMFVCWSRGACLCCPPRESVMAPARFIKEKKLTMWASVPSVVACASRLKTLKPGAFPSIRFSMFCGEVLTAASARLWQEATPNSLLANFYGPTEATVAITCYRWAGEQSEEMCRNGIVPIGWMFEGQKGCIVNAEDQVAGPGQAGELCLSGSQVIDGYLDAPENNARKFIKVPVLGEKTWYRTGDLAMQDEDGCLHYLGRIDDQVQVRGHRVELGEIDFVLRKAAGTEEAVAVPSLVNVSNADSIYAFVCGKRDRNDRDILNYCREWLPDYMVPQRVYFVDGIPRNINGKIDRRRLIEEIRE